MKRQINRNVATFQVGNNNDVAIARALNRGSIILADEPTGNRSDETARMCASPKRMYAIAKNVS